MLTEEDKNQLNKDLKYIEKRIEDTIILYTEFNRLFNQEQNLLKKLKQEKERIEKLLKE